MAVMDDDSALILLEAKNLYLKRLWTNLSFVVRAGSMLQIVGDNGAGKTSLIKILCGLLAPDRGRVLWRRQNIRQAAEDYCADLIYIGHKDALNGELTPLENLRFAAALHNSTPAVSPARSLAQFGLAGDDGLCRELSAGQRRRTTLARLLLNHARLWFLDEPLTALDAAGRRILGDLVAAHLSAGGAVVMATHQPPGWAMEAQMLHLQQPAK